MCRRVWNSTLEFSQGGDYAYIVTFDTVEEATEAISKQTCFMRQWSLRPCAQTYMALQGWLLVG